MGHYMRFTCLIPINLLYFIIVPLLLLGSRHTVLYSSGLSGTSQQYFYLRANQHRTNQHYTRPETICPGTGKLACWRVQLSTASKVGRRGAGIATASIEASLLAGDIIHLPAQMVPFMLADELCRLPA
jgi:hypothetical protein